MNKLNELKEKKLDNKGFSLVELIIVIAIMAVLIGVLAPTYLKYVERSRESADIDNINQIVTTCETFAADPVDGEMFTNNDDTVSCNNKGELTVADQVKKALESAGMPTETTALPKMKSEKYKDWTITFHSAGIQFSGTNGAKVAEGLGRASVSAPTSTAP